MPSNEIVINGVIHYELGDSKMDGLFSYLAEHGVGMGEESKPEITEEVKKDET